MTRSAAASGARRSLPVFVFNLPDIAAAARLQRTLSWHGYRVEVHQPADAEHASTEARECDAVVFASPRPVRDTTSEVRRRCPRTRIVTTVVVDDVVIVQPYEATAERSLREETRMRTVAAAVRTVKQTA